LLLLDLSMPVLDGLQVLEEIRCPPRPRRSHTGPSDSSLVHAYGSGGVYANFPDPDLEEWGRAYHRTNLDRLRRVKATYDPENLFRFDQSVEPA
jgi:hypothetical protein